jgi:hypothetical protein
MHGGCSQHQFLVQHDGALAVAICEREPESKALLSADRGMSLAARRQRTGLGRCDKVLLKQRPKTKRHHTKTVRLHASHGAAFLHFTHESMSHTSVSVFTDEMPKTCKPTTSKIVSNFRNCPGTIAPTRALKDETAAGQPIQSFTGISVNMRQLPAARFVQQRLQ